MNLLELFASLFKFVFKSVLMSTIIFVAGYSLVTRTFPPDFRRLSKMYEGYSKLNAIKAGKMPPEKTPAHSNFSDDPDLDLLMRQRMQLAELTAQLNITEGPPVQAYPKAENRGRSTVTIPMADYNDLKAQLKSLNADNLALRKRVIELVNARKLQRQATSEKPK